jgi:flagellar biosynthesis protein FlhF
MKLKSFFANSIEEAIRLARQELGPDAMLVNSKRTGVEAQHLGFYEVVVCGDTEEAGSRKGCGQEAGGEFKKTGSGGLPASLPVDKLSRDISELKQQMEKLALTLARSGRGMTSVAFDPELSRAFTTLTDAELDTELAYDVVGKLTSPISEAILRAELAKLATADSELGLPGAPSRVVALVGPPGAGKTSALVKLAVRYGLAAGKTVQVLTTDTYRIAAAEELCSYAAILGIGCQVLETPTALAQVLGERAPKDLILIDTPGLCQSEWDACQDLARLLATHPAVDTHLVLPASMRAADLRRISEQYSVFQPRKLLFTRMDETETFGPILSRSVRMGSPVSFFSRGQRIPEDLEPATTDLLLDLVLGPLALEGRSAPPKFGVVAA